jgi:hypothetical protein
LLAAALIIYRRIVLGWAFRLFCYDSIS